MLFGDFNIYLLNKDCNNSTSFLNTMYSLSLLPIISKPTRITDISATLIIYLLINFNYSILIKGSCDVRSLIAPLKHPRGALVAHRNSLAHPRCKTSQYRRSFIPLSVSLWNDLSDPVFDGEGLAGFKSRANTFLLAWSTLSFLTPTNLSFSSFHGLVVWGWGLWTDRVFSHSPGLAQRTPNDNNNNHVTLYWAY